MTSLIWYNTATELVTIVATTPSEL